MWNLCHPGQGHVEGWCIMYWGFRHLTQSVHMEMPKMELACLCLWILNVCWLHLLASVTAHLCIVRSVIVVIQCWSHLIIQTPAHSASSLYLCFCLPMSSCLPPFISLFVRPFQQQDYLSSNCPEVCCVFSGQPHPSSSNIKGVFQKRFLFHLHHSFTI